MMLKAIKMLFGRSEPKKGTHTKEFVADGLPLITIDEAHNHTSADATQEYAVPPCDRLLVDASCYRFCVPEQLGVSGPDVLHLIHGAEEYYRLSWDGAGKICVDANSLEAVRGPSRFAGFSRGEKYILGVGVDGVANADHKLSFAPLWVGLVNVE